MSNPPCYFGDMKVMPNAKFARSQNVLEATTFSSSRGLRNCNSPTLNQFSRKIIPEYDTLSKDMKLDLPISKRRDGVSVAISKNISTLLRNHFLPARSRSRQITIGIDLDSTIAEIAPLWLARLNKVCHTDYTAEMWTDWNLGFLKEDEKKIFFEVFTPDLYESVKPYFGATEAVRALARKPGVKLICVTTNPSHNADEFVSAKKQWLRRYFPDLAGSVVFSKVKSGLGLDVLVDDAPQHFEKTDFIPILVERPWNKSVSCVLRFNEWSAGRSLLLSLVDQFAQSLEAAKPMRHRTPSRHQREQSLALYHATA